MRSGLLVWSLLGATALWATHAPAAPTAYDKAAAAARTQYAANAAKCRKHPAVERQNCLKLAKEGARASLAGTYSDAVASAHAAYARTVKRCKTQPSTDRRRCLRNALNERSIALGKAEEIRSAPLAMGINN